MHYKTDRLRCLRGAGLNPPQTLIPSNQFPCILHDIFQSDGSQFRLQGLLHPRQHIVQNRMDVLSHRAVCTWILMKMEQFSVFDAFHRMVDIKERNRSSPGLPHKEQRNRARARVGSDGRADVADQEILESEPLLYQIPHIFRVLQGVPVADEHIVLPVLLLPGAHLLLHVVHPGAEGFFPDRKSTRLNSSHS